MKSLFNTIELKNLKSEKSFGSFRYLGRVS